MNIYGVPDVYVITSDYAAHLADPARAKYPGDDWANPNGGGIDDAVCCVVDGADVGAFQDPDLGNVTTVSFDYNNARWDLYYCHLNHTYTNFGEYKKGVAKGTIVGRVGNTGNSTGPHCHLTVKKNQIIVDPHSQEVVDMLNSFATKPIELDKFTSYMKELHELTAKYMGKA